MSGHVGEGRFSLILEGNDLPIDLIEEQLGLAPTRIIHKGDVLNRLPLMTAEHDEWTHTIELVSDQGTDNALNALLARLILCAPALAQWQQQGINVVLRLLVQSDYAQMAFKLMPETLSRLVATGLPLDVTSISWGELGI